MQSRRGGARRKDTSLSKTFSASVKARLGHSSTAVVENVSEYVERIAFLRANNIQDLILFRGHRVCRWQLVPKVGRRDARLKGDSPLALGAVESRMFESFQQMGLPFLKLNPETKLEWLAVAQHHGLPTRLLDWTRNALAALWFAVRKEPVSDQDASIWILNPADDDFIEPAAESAPFQIEQVRVYRPRHITERIVAQSGYFTLHPLDRTICGFHPLTNDPKFRKRLIEIQIASRAFSNLRDDLERCGVSDVTMFPDLEGVCRYIAWNNCLLEDEIDPPNVLLNQNA